MEMSVRMFTGAFALFLIAQASVAQQQAPTRLTLQDLLAVPLAPTYALSPDGQQFATLQDEQIALWRPASGLPVLLTTTLGAKSELAWSPDGKQIAFVSQGAIWVVAASGGAPRRLTTGTAGNGDPRGASDHSPRWNPRGRWILFDSGRSGQDELYVVAEDGGVTTRLVSTEIYPEGSWHGKWFGDSGDSVSSDRFDPTAAWSPDGTRIAYTERSLQHFSGVLKVLPFDREHGQAAGEPVTLYTSPEDRGGAWAVDQPAWSPDGRHLAIALQQSGWDNIYLLPSDGGAPHQLTAVEAEDTHPVFSPDGRWLALLSNRGVKEEQHVWIVDVASGKARQLAKETAGVETSPQWSGDAKHLFFLRSTPSDSSSLFEASVATGQDAVRLDDTLPVNFRNTGEASARPVTFSGADGLPLTGILYTPPGYTAGHTYPAVLSIHGGPEGQSTLSFAPWPIYLAQQGYVVLEPNYRGSTGYGEHFRNLNVGDCGGGEVSDIAAAVHYLTEQKLADPKRIGIVGASHGGTMVAYALTKFPTLFAVGVDISGVVDRATYNERTNRNSAIRWTIKMGGTPAEVPTNYRRADILPDVGKITAPVLLLHGQDDPQVPPFEAAQFAAALKHDGKQFIYVTYPGEGHGFRQPVHRLDAWKRELDFLNQYLNPTYGNSSTSVEVNPVYDDTTSP